MGRRPWELTERDREVLLEDEHVLLRWLSAFDYPMSKEDMHNRLPRWPGRSLDALLKKGSSKESNVSMTEKLMGSPKDSVRPRVAETW